MIDIVLDNVDVRDVNGRKVIDAWVHEDGMWAYRELTDAEAHYIATLDPFASSGIKQINNLN